MNASLRIPWPITVVAVLVTVAVFTMGVIMTQVQTIAAEAAPGWWDFVAATVRGCSCRPRSWG